MRNDLDPCNESFSQTEHVPNNAVLFGVANNARVSLVERQGFKRCSCAKKDVTVIIAFVRSSKICSTILYVTVPSRFVRSKLDSIYMTHSNTEFFGLQ